MIWSDFILCIRGQRETLSRVSWTQQQPKTGLILPPSGRLYVRPLRMLTDILIKHRFMSCLHTYWRFPVYSWASAELSDWRCLKMTGQTGVGGTLSGADRSENTKKQQRYRHFCSDGEDKSNKPERHFSSSKMTRKDLFSLKTANMKYFHPPKMYVWFIMLYIILFIIWFYCYSFIYKTLDTFPDKIS